MKNIKHTLQSSVYIPKPASLLELKGRLDRIKGSRLLDICKALDIAMPENSKSGKGFAGQVVEYILGADAKTLPIPDFSHLNVELKTLPVDENMMPLESTFICHADLKPVSFVSFENSHLYAKISCILFVFILSPKGLPLPDRRIAGYYFFTPTEKELAIMKEDYNELMDMVCQGRAHEINARLGTIIQMRPKAASGSELTKIIDSSGKISYTRPRGFYMRRNFTQAMCIKLQSNL